MIQRLFFIRLAIFIAWNFVSLWCIAEMLTEPNTIANIMALLWFGALAWVDTEICISLYKYFKQKHNEKNV